MRFGGPAPLEFVNGRVGPGRQFHLVERADGRQRIQAGENGRQTGDGTQSAQVPDGRAGNGTQPAQAG
jgi:hypothetical protein